MDGCIFGADTMHFASRAIPAVSSDLVWGAYVGRHLLWAMHAVKALIERFNVRFKKA